MLVVTGVGLNGTWKQTCMENSDLPPKSGILTFSDDVIKEEYIYYATNKCEVEIGKFVRSGSIKFTEAFGEPEG